MSLLFLLAKMCYNRFVKFVVTPVQHYGESAKLGSNDQGGQSMEHVKKFTSVFYKDTERKAKKTLKKLREDDGVKWKELNAYIQPLKSGGFRVVRKYSVK